MAEIGSYSSRSRLLRATVVFVMFIAVGGGWSPRTMVVATDSNLPDCRSVLVTLQGCLQFVTGYAASPSADCCSGVLDVHLTDPKCLCVMARDDNTTNIIPNYRLDLAEQLPTLCQIQGASISNCPALLGETNATIPAAGPVGAPLPVTQDAGGAHNLTTSRNLKAVIITYWGTFLAASALISYVRC